MIMKCNIFNGQTIADVSRYLERYPVIYIVADRHVAHFAEKVVKSLTGGEADCECEAPLSPELLLLDTSEEDKSMQTIMEICKWLLDNGADRNALLLAIGGGITTDMAGFAASIYKRGIRFAYIPTTFLSQVDAAIGGKTGVNFENYKNILGVIRQPEFTYIFPEVLETLPYRDFLSGAAELIKTFIIDNAGNNYEKAVEVLSEIHESIDRKRAIASHLAELEELAGAAARIKAGVVERDEFEQGERRKLNLGHTFAHAIEWEARAAKKDISHGEAVAMGIILAAKASERYYGQENIEEQEVADESLSARFTRDFSRCGLPTECPFPLESLSGAMRKDKKAENGIVHFVLIRTLGDVRIEDLAVESAQTPVRPRIPAARCDE